MLEHSLLLIKPNAVQHKHIGHIISLLERGGYHISALKLFRFDEKLASRFYAEHVGKSFFPGLVQFMTSADTVAIIVEKENVIHDLRELIGAVEPEKRKPGTIRFLFGEGVTENGVHASDSDVSANREIGVIFGS
ncbi:MAG: nucleoside-diphosphate kinase [Candidatus Cloacimonetes bacterium HGW-Cloacimonetes-3]|jgi:nucleoside-diphosphate kinase|nr:MAG: nucleoside-diphosphate kinase [Candidatus Cloacimonetes bacterium HGW-Cloacimonetes-3]